MLYIGLGDGGSGGDPQGNGQRTNTLLGKILRIDVDNGDPYSIPSGNPFANQSGARPEIWAFGLRNPWRFSFDRTAGLLFVADVGQGSLEEIDVVPTTRAGVNYGWNIMEGSSCFGSGSCSTAGLEPPVIEYNHSGGACSVTGGYAYRGSAIPELAGHYFYSDYCAGFLRSFLYSNGAATDQRTWDVGTIGSVTSFGEDAAGEMYIVVQQGRVYRIGRGP
jgi:glucose/arabinose dehydrogenase